MSAPTDKDIAVESLRPFLTAANVRGSIDDSHFCISSGLGQVGDLVLGSVIPKVGHKITIIDNARIAHQVQSTQRVVAVLGPRDSSTHVCATIPAGGLKISRGTPLHWVAGESGIVGCLEQDPPANSVHNGEVAIDFVCDGLVANAEHQIVNVRDFAVSPADRDVSIPIVLIGATSSESGKTRLSGELINHLSTAGIRVGAIKVTGTGGVLDSLHHLQSGAATALDNVDAGLITTHCDRLQFRRSIPLVFREMGDRAVDIIVAELGGDILSANNPEIFSIEELMERTLLLVALSNDAVAAAGINAINEEKLRFPAQRIVHFTSPFRNHAGMARRMALAGIARCYDPRSTDDIAGITALIVDQFMPDLQKNGPTLLPPATVVQDKWTTND